MFSEVLKEQHSSAETKEPEPPKKKINLLLVASDSDDKNEHASVLTALDCYRAEPVISVDTYPLKWCLKHEGTYETLPHLAHTLRRRLQQCHANTCSHFQLRTHRTRDARIYVQVTSRAMVEDCSGVRFAPYTWSYPGIEGDYESSGLDRGRNNWNLVDDFDWLGRE
ncbi:Tubulin-specific chaperone C [Chelonia mydas]|uniref:Tubulin-specific chaperone C n=1 Tax=Chelonia mydas TaxID=8469 RepID=M7BHT7_CHEMY|nr:Tubulin-specific chaperone C [Chelonia mydas]